MDGKRHKNRADTTNRSGVLILKGEIEMIKNVNDKEYKCDIKEKIETLEGNVSTLTTLVYNFQGQVEMLEDKINMKADKFK